MFDFPYTLTKIRVYKKLISASNFTEVAIYTTNLNSVRSWTDNQVVAGFTYVYKIGVEVSQYPTIIFESENFTVTAPATSSASPSELTTTIQNVNRVLLQWKDNTQARYQFAIQRSTSANPDWSTVGVLAQTSNTNYTDIVPVFGTTYYYRISLVMQGTRTLPSNVASATIIPFPTPHNVQAVSIGDTKIKLNWSFQIQDNVQFKIYRKNGTSYTLLGTLGNFTFSNQQEYFFENTNSLVLGTTYRYKIEVLHKAYFNATSFNSYSSFSEVDVLFGHFPTPVLQGNAISHHQIKLDWTYDASLANVVFNVYRANAGSADYQLVASNLVANTRTYTDENLFENNSYLYKLEVVRAGIKRDVTISVKTLSAVKWYYAYKDGNWDDLNTWTLTPGIIDKPSILPDANDIVVIENQQVSFIKNLAQNIHASKVFVKGSRGKLTIQGYELKVNDEMNVYQGSYLEVINAGKLKLNNSKVLLKDKSSKIVVGSGGYLGVVPITQ
jgi:fibronectin type 3 domain-containing protein